MLVSWGNPCHVCSPLLWYFVHLWMFGLPLSFPLVLIFNIFCNFRFRDQRYASPTMCFESKTHVMMQRGMQADQTISSEHCKHLDAWKKTSGFILIQFHQYRTMLYWSTAKGNEMSNICLMTEPKLQVKWSSPLFLKLINLSHLQM